MEDNRMHCGCQSEFQDKMYGKNIRVATINKTGHKSCTVCGGKPCWEKRLEAHYGPASSFSPEVLMKPLKSTVKHIGPGPYKWVGFVAAP